MFQNIPRKVVADMTKVPKLMNRSYIVLASPRGYRNIKSHKVSAWSDGTLYKWEM